MRIADHPAGFGRRHRLVGEIELEEFAPEGEATAPPCSVDRERDEEGAVRLLIPSRIRPSLTWVDVPEATADKLRFDCDQDTSRSCARKHRLRNIGDNPGQLLVDDRDIRPNPLDQLQVEGGGDEQVPEP